MSTSRPFAFNTGSTIDGTLKYGDLAVGVSQNLNYSEDVGGVRWWNGPDEDLGYVIAYPNYSGNQPNPVFVNAYLGFKRTKLKTDQDFINLTNRVFNQNFVTGDQCKTYLESNGYWTSWPDQIPLGMVLFLDAGDTNSYPSSGGTIWYDLSGYNNHGTINGPIFSGISGGTFIFDGVNDAITFSNPVEIPVGNDPYTISVWFNSDEMPSTRGFIGWGAFGNVNQVNAWRLQTFGGGATGFVHYWWGNDLQFQTPLSANTWYNAIVAYSNGSRKIYLNNVLVAEDFPTGHDVPYSTNLRVGVTYDGFNEWFDGKIAQVIIYKRQATTQEIEAIWNSGKYRFGYGSVTPTPTPTPTSTPTPTPTATPTPTPTSTPTATPTPTPTPTATASGNLRVLFLGDGNVSTVSSNISTYLTNTGNSITYSAVTMGTTYTGSGGITKSNYDVVMIYTNSSQVGTTTMANALTTFVGQGGSVVSGVFLWNLNPTGYNFTGTTAFNVTNSQSSSVGNFSAVTATTITNGIGTALPASFTNSNPSLVSGAIALARFTNNEICLALKTVGSSRNISINAWPGNITTSTSTICKMFGNAILYAGGKLN